RPSSDAYLNLIGAATMAVDAQFSGVYVVMHADPSDETLAVHLGTRVRKNHTSARDAFKSIGVLPVAHWSRRGLSVTEVDLPLRKKERDFAAKPNFEPRVALVKFYPSMSSAYLTALLGSGLRGVVFEGTGLGHINSKNIELVRKFIEGGGLVCMSSQCIWGRIDLKVYDTGRDLLKAGVVPLEDMLPETALVKLMWVLANSTSLEEARKLMQEDLSGETTKRTIDRR
ncbi:MAG: asparaginase domain-containing protein, partial [Thaumarchaeota archaeon]|nr:asparaginase domain-containing protein [Nitrososphaerota archaeon]